MSSGGTSLPAPTPVRVRKARPGPTRSQYGGFAKPRSPLIRLVLTRIAFHVLSMCCSPAEPVGP
jgi:hypothetical protein